MLALGCSPAPPRPVTIRDFATPAALDGQKVIVEGYPGVVRKETQSEEGYQMFLITQYEAKVMGENPSVAVMARAGSAPNQAEELRDGYTIRDLKLHCADGSPATFLDRVRVQGSVEVRGLGRWIWVDRIEKL